MKIELKNITRQNELYSILNFLIKNEINFKIWREEIGKKEYCFWQDEKIANLLLSMPNTGKTEQLFSLLPLCIGQMNDDKLAFILEQSSIINSAYFNFSDTLFQCCANVKLKSIETLIKIGVKNGRFEAYRRNNEWGVCVMLSNIHIIQNGTLQPFWKSEVVQLLDDMDSPFVVIVPDSIYFDSYIMGITELMALHDTSNIKLNEYKFVGSYLVGSDTWNWANAIYFPSEEIGMMWWEQVKKIVKL